MWSRFENVMQSSEHLLHPVYCTSRNRTISIFHGQHCVIHTLLVFCYRSDPCLSKGVFTGGFLVTCKPVSLMLFTGPSFHSADFIRMLAIFKELCLYMLPLLSVLLCFYSCDYKMQDALWIAGRSVSALIQALWKMIVFLGLGKHRKFGLFVSVSWITPPPPPKKKLDS